MNSPTLHIPDQHSHFETVFKVQPPRLLNGYIERVRTSPGYNTSRVPMLIFGLHLGQPTWIARTRGDQRLTRRVTRGEIIFTPPGEPLRYGNDQVVDALYFGLDQHTLSEAAESAQLDLSRLQWCENWALRDLVIERIGHELLAEKETNAPGSLLYTEGLILQLLAHLLRHYAVAPSSKPFADRPIAAVPGSAARIRDAVAYIHAHLAEPLSLEQVAATVYLTPYHFSRVFKAETGFSPHQYIIRKRVEAAYYLLHETDMTVSQVAAHVGFADHSHLTRHYRRVMGSSPRT